MSRVVVVGAGPAGLAAAIFARRAGAAVILAERNRQCGAKLLATGGGHCNAGNLRPPAEWPALFGKRGRFIVPALNFLPREALEHWFAELGEPLEARDGFHLFPKSRSAKNIRDALRSGAESIGVEILPDSLCTGVLTENGEAAGVRLKSPAASGAVRNEACGRIILATGGNSWSATGSDWTGCRIAEALGHTVAPPVPGLVGLRSSSIPSDLSGLVLPRAGVAFKVKGKKEERCAGELLLTHTGVSGPAVLDLSASVCAATTAGGGPAVLRIRWAEDMPAAAWLGLFDDWRGNRGGASVASLLREHLPPRLAKWLCALAGVDPETSAASVKATSRDALVPLLSDFPAEIQSGEGWDKAMITRGGAAPREINPQSMESRKQNGLFLAGEMIDVDGPCGGYNLHWAFASGALAGHSAATG